MVKINLSTRTPRSHVGVEVQLHSFLISALYEGEWSASRPSRFPPRKTAPVPSVNRREMTFWRRAKARVMLRIEHDSWVVQLAACHYTD